MSNPNACAFPTVASDPGLTIREEFAKAAMQGLLAHFGDDHQTHYVTARCAVQQADALIAELAKPTAEPFYNLMLAFVKRVARDPIARADSSDREILDTIFDEARQLLKQTKL